MRAAVLPEIPSMLQVTEIQVDRPGPHEVLVRTVAAGLCHSDLHFMEGKYGHDTPTVPGHEAAGVVEAVGANVTHVQPGDHVIGCLSIFCGRCEYCLSGRPVLCDRQGLARGDDQPPRLSRDGVPIHQFLRLSAFAEMMLVHENALVKIREEMPLDRAALIGCAVTTGLGAVFNTAKVSPGSTVAVIGCGGVGLNSVQGAVITGAGRVIAVDTNSEQSFAMLRKGGTATIIGMIPEGERIELPGSEFMDEKKIQGSNMGSNRFRVDIPRYVDLYLSGRLKLDELVSARIGLDQINDGFDAMRRGEVARSVIEFA
ncbi:MAG: Zinc-containing alcohol dehydrogenase superfamily [Thermomicrobiales bacterium]|nr:Zinc-containing alcohol dehydrogenase superfamily [Thermomicrobiales bacterium]